MVRESVPPTILHRTSAYAQDTAQLQQPSDSDTKQFDCKHIIQLMKRHRTSDDEAQQYDGTYKRKNMARQKPARQNKQSSQ